VFGEHTLSGREMLALAAISVLLLAGYGLNTLRIAHPLLRLTLFRVRTFRAAVSGSFFHAPGHRRHSVPVSAALPGGFRFQRHRVWPAHDAPGVRRHEPQGDDARILNRFGYRRFYLHTVMRACSSCCLPASDANACVAHCRGIVLLRIFRLAAVHQQ